MPPWDLDKWLSYQSLLSKNMTLFKLNWKNCDYSINKAVSLLITLIILSLLITKKDYPFFHIVEIRQGFVELVHFWLSLTDLNRIRLHDCIYRCTMIIDGFKEKSITKFIIPTAWNNLPENIKNIQKPIFSKSSNKSILNNYNNLYICPRRACYICNQ